MRIFKQLKSEKNRHKDCAAIIFSLFVSGVGFASQEALPVENWTISKIPIGRHEDFPSLCLESTSSKGENTYSIPQGIIKAIVIPKGYKPSCTYGAYPVDLEKRLISINGKIILDSNFMENFKGMLIATKSIALLENIRQDELLAVQQAQRETYLAAYDDASTLPKILDFEKSYSSNDPDNLIDKLRPMKAKLIYQKYQDTYANAKTSEMILAFIEKFQLNDPDGLIEQARKRLPQVKKQEADAALRLERERKKEIQQKELGDKQARIDESKNRLKFILSLRGKYEKNIVAHSTQAYEIVARYNINCRTPDQRALPLMHALLASAKSFERSGGEIKFHLQNRASSVRIYGEALKNGKQLGEPSLYYEINEWGDLRPVAIRSEAVLNACLGSQGPIWLMPGEPGY